MRDGTRLSVDLYLPEADHPAPAILVRTPYTNTRDDFVAWGRYFPPHGYAVAIQDVRGRGDSDGVFTPWVDDFEDGYDTVEWVARQSWCDGRVGMLGGSYMAWVQWTAATRRPPHLVTMVAAGSPGRWGRDWPYRYGAFWAEDYMEWLYRVSGRSLQLSSIPDWGPVHRSRDLRQLDAQLGQPNPHWQAALDHPTVDAYWQQLTVTGYEKMDWPVLHITGWYDPCAPGSLHHFREMLARSPAADRQALLLGAWNHGGGCKTGQLVPGSHDAAPDASLDLHKVWLEWFDRWLAGRPGARETWPRVRYYALGGGWRDADGWPPREARLVRLALHADGSLDVDGRADISGSGDVDHARLWRTLGRSSAHPTAGTRTYRYAPDDPTPAIPVLDAGPPPDPRAEDLRFLEARADVLSYTTSPIATPLEVAGSVTLLLHAASSAPDTDFGALLSDVHPDGRSVLLSFGIRRASFRESLTDPTLLSPHEIYALDLELSDVAHVVRAGHRLRLTVTSCLFPYYHPNPNTGEPLGAETRRQIAIQTIHHGPEHPSHLALFVLPG
jgi:putative CocE/NonD family hydrolase